MTTAAETTVSSSPESALPGTGTNNSLPRKKFISKADLRAAIRVLTLGDPVVLEFQNGFVEEYVVKTVPKCGRGKGGSWSVNLKTPGGDYHLLAMKTNFLYRRVTTPTHKLTQPQPPATSQPLPS